jgi:hypothetical protein
MATTSIFKGSILPTIGATHIIGTVSALQAGVYQLQTDVGRLAAGDIVEQKINMNVGAGSMSCAYSSAPAWPMATQIELSPPVALGGNSTLTATIQQSAGSAKWIFFDMISI